MKPPQFIRLGSLEAVMADVIVLRNSRKAVLLGLSASDRRERWRAPD